jgi:hypothetical protein
MAVTKPKVKKTATAVAKKAKTVAKNTGEYASKNPKTVLYIGLGLVTIFAGFKIYRTFFPPDPEAEAPDKDENYPDSTMTSAQAKIIANRLYSAMNQSGTDEAEVFDALRGLTVNYFIKVFDEFGLRRYSVQFGNSGLPFIDDHVDLNFWLTSELNTTELNELKAIVPGLQF